MKFITLKFHYLVAHDFIMKLVRFKSYRLCDMLIKEKKSHLPAFIVILQTSVVR